MDKKVDLSIVVLSYNTKKLLENCLNSLINVKSEANFEVIVVDNNSSDGSAEMVGKEFPGVTLLKSEQNLGFAGGNNKAKNYCKGKFVLFLNSDTVVLKGAIKKTLEYMETNNLVGALTCKLVLPDGSLDRDTKRSFPTPWVALTHFSGLDKLFPKSTLFSKYWYGYLSNESIQEVDVIQGAFFLTRKKILDEVNWFDEDYFLDGEDIDLCWKIKEKGYKIIYYPLVSITHVKGASKGKLPGHNMELTKEDRKRFVATGVDSMKIFYKKHLEKKYPYLVSLLVYFGINIIKTFRTLNI